VEKGVPIKDRCWRRASKKKQMWRPSKSEDTDPFFSNKSTVRFSSKNPFYILILKRRK
jgi:hypothetical protein